jgi:diguanylate cyclase (GGDEF)-like protein
MSAPSILLCSDDAERCRQWADMLAPAAPRLHCGFAELGPDEPLDVIVTDRPIAPEDAGAVNRQIAGGEVGVVAIDLPTSADVSLPRDFTPRELRLACLLLTEIVRLRRERREGARARKVLSHLALSDPLTGLANRRAWDEELASRAQAAASGPSLCIALFDLDYFKRVNDACGHAVGDTVLQAVARRLKGSIRHQDHAARLGGDEFGLLVSGIAAGDALALVERVRQALRHPPDSDCPCDVTASAGFVIHSPAAGDTIPAPEQIYRSASEALRRAKTGGRNRTVGA